MKAVLQRVKNAKVEVEGKKIAEIEKGILVLVGFEKDDLNDIDKKFDYFAQKITGLRIFEDENGKMNLSVKDIDGKILAVSNFTLAGSVKKGKRPSFDNAMPPLEAKECFKKFVNELKKHNVCVEEGEFQAYMQVSFTNDGPVTFLIEK